MNLFIRYPMCAEARKGLSVLTAMRAFGPALLYLSSWPFAAWRLAEAILPYLTNMAVCYMLEYTCLGHAMCAVAAHDTYTHTHI